MRNFRSLHVFPALAASYTIDTDQPLGCGATSKVYLAYHIPSATPRAVKVVPKAALKTPEARAALASEVAALKQMNKKDPEHPELASQYASSFYEMLEDKKYVYLVMEFFKAGDLVDLLKNRSKPLPLKLALQYGYHVLSAVEELHRNGIAHRDIKLDNFVCEPQIFDDSLDSQVSQELPQHNIKLVDYGMVYNAHKLKDEIFHSMKVLRTTDSRLLIRYCITTTPCGTVPYVAPEILQSRPYSPFLADIYSAGVVLYALICNRIPYSELTYDHDSTNQLENARIMAQAIIAGDGPGFEEIAWCGSTLDVNDSKKLFDRGAELLHAIKILIEDMMSRCPSRRPLATEARNRLKNIIDCIEKALNCDDYDAAVCLARGSSGTNVDGKMGNGFQCVTSCGPGCVQIQDSNTNSFWYFLAGIFGWGGSASKDVRVVGY